MASLSDALTASIPRHLREKQAAQCFPTRPAAPTPSLSSSLYSFMSVCLCLAPGRVWSLHSLITDLKVACHSELTVKLTLDQRCHNATTFSDKVIQNVGKKKIQKREP